MIAGLSAEPDYRAMLLTIPAAWAGTGRLRDRLGRRITDQGFHPYPAGQQGRRELLVRPVGCTLVSEPCTGKSTVLRALNDLETNRCLSRQPRGSPPTSGSPNGSTTPTRPQNWAARRRGGRRHMV